MSNSLTSSKRKSGMDFLQQFDPEKGDEKQVESVERSNIVYLSKKQPCDMVLRLEKAFIKISENPKDEGEEKFIAVFTIVDKTVGQNDAKMEGETDAVVGDKVSYFVNLSTQRSKMAQKFAFEELVEFMSAMTGTEQRSYLKEPEQIRDHLEDDAGEYQGNYFNLVTKPPKKGWHNFEWHLLDEFEEAAAE